MGICNSAEEPADETKEQKASRRESKQTPAAPPPQPSSPRPKAEAPQVFDVKQKAASDDPRVGEYNKLFADKGEMVRCNDDGPNQNTYYKSGIRTVKKTEEGKPDTNQVIFKDGTLFQEQGGNVIHAYPDKSRFNLFENGTTQEIIPGDEGETSVQTSPDGTKLTEQPDGSRITECRPDLPGGTIEVRADGTKIQTYGPDSPEGAITDTITKYTDGTTVQIQRDGKYITMHPLDDPPPEDHPVPSTKKDRGYQESSWPTWGPHKRDLPQWAKDEIAKKKAAAEAAAAAAEAARLAEEEAERQRIEHEREMAERARKEAEEKQRAEEEAARQREEHERKMKELAEEEARQAAEEEFRRRQEEEAERQRVRAEAEEKARKAAEEAFRRQQEEEAERARIAAEEEAARLAAEQAVSDEEARKRKRREEATAWFYELNYMEIKKWLNKNNVPKKDIFACLGIYELRQLAIHSFGENFMLKMEKA